MNRPSAAQTNLDVTTPEEKQREANRQHQLFAALMGEIRAATIAMGGPKLVADSLDRLWGSEVHGRGVSESKYRACLADDGERNYFRIEWIIELALHPGVAEVLRRIADGKADIEPADELANLYELINEELPKQAATLKRRARAMRKARR